MHKIVTAFKCPICDQAIQVVNLRNVVCTNNHTFDIAKQGYINFMMRPVTNNYGKKLFEARHKVITEIKLYSPLHKEITNIIKQHQNVSATPFLLADLGCGEGSHLHSIMEYLRNFNVTGVGLDISKEGVLIAARNYTDPIWFVGDLAKSPLSDHSFHFILNILSPANYTEFKRILTHNGLIIKVVPRSGYLKELREALFANESIKAYQNDHTASLFKEHFQPITTKRVEHTQVLQKDELTHLVQMTPLTWSADQQKIDSFIDQDFAEITVDLDVLVGKRK